jgi:nicotinamide-nucleotide amidase
METELLNIVGKIADTLIANGLRLSVAESCTGGFISDAITNYPGASKFFEMSVVAYSRGAKHAVLGISDSLLDKYGTVSDETALEMAHGVRRLGNANVALSVTGIAGPEPLEEKEVGLIFIAVATEKLSDSMGIKLSGDREEIKEKAALEALTFLHRILRIWL